MHCQTELRSSPCSVSSCFSPEIATTFGTEKFFSCGCLDLMLDYNGFEGLHLYRFSFICRNFLMWWHFRLAARHFTNSILKWSFSDFLNRVWFLRIFLIFFASYSLGYLWKQNLPHERVRFFPDDCHLQSCQHQRLCSRLNVGLLFH